MCSIYTWMNLKIQNARIFKNYNYSCNLKKIKIKIPKFQKLVTVLCEAMLEPEAKKYIYISNIGSRFI